MKPLFYFTALICLLTAACNKKEQKQYSDWYVNNEHYSTNDVEEAVGKGGIAILASNGSSERFDILFRISRFPESGTWYLRRTVSNNPDSVNVSIYRGGKTYVPALHNLNGLTASVVNGKTRYALPDGWFINYFNAADSVRVSGNFSRP